MGQNHARPWLSQIAIVVCAGGVSKIGFNRIWTGPSARGEGRGRMFVLDYLRHPSLLHRSLGRSFSWRKLVGRRQAGAKVTKISANARLLIEDLNDDDDVREGERGRERRRRQRREQVSRAADGPEPPLLQDLICQSRRARRETGATCYNSAGQRERERERELIRKRRQLTTIAASLISPCDMAKRSLSNR